MSNVVVASQPLRTALTRVFAGLAVIGALVVGLAGPAGAAGSGTVTISPNPVPFTSSQTKATVQVAWTGQKVNKLVFIDICRKSISDPTFDIGLDCSLLSEVAPNGTATGAGSKAYNIFRGENPDGDSGWGCFAPGDTAPAGVDKLTTCYVRVTNDSSANSNDAVEAAYTLSVGGDTVPEAPLGVIIPIIGAVVVAGAFFLLRRRATAAS